MILFRYMMIAAGFWQDPHSPVIRATALFLLFALLSIQVLLPFAYLAVIRYRNLNPFSSKEVSMLQADIHCMLQAVRTLKHVPQAVISSSKLANSASAPLVSPIQFEAPNKHRDEHSLTMTHSSRQASPAEAPKDSVGLSSTKATLGCATENQATDQPPSQLRIRPSHVILQITSDLDPAADCEADEGSVAFQAQLAAALGAASQTIANLIARLEMIIYYRSSVRIQGHAACTAALAM